LKPKHNKLILNILKQIHYCNSPRNWYGKSGWKQACWLAHFESFW